MLWQYGPELEHLRRQLYTMTVTPYAKLYFAVVTVSLLYNVIINFVPCLSREMPCFAEPKRIAHALLHCSI